MYHGEDVAKASYANASCSQRVVEASGSLDMRPREQRVGGTVAGIISHAESVHSLSMDRLSSLSEMASRALNLATRLAGPFPAPGLEAPEKSPGDDPAVSALDEAQRRVAELRRPLKAMDLQFARLSEALDAIERSFG